LRRWGSRGVRVYSEGRVVRIPAVEARPADTTGAGDVFSAVFDYKIMWGYPPEEAAVWATAASTLKIKEVGAKRGVPSYTELESYVETIRGKITPVIE